mmetsp:Transcript_13399/g.28396  ORF Transcript_13399/g.28396 Transcript_13399/m.28396 type:complete len:258 (+) Transcript_13399:226-999(+)
MPARNHTKKAQTTKKSTVTMVDKTFPIVSLMPAPLSSDKTPPLLEFFSSSVIMRASSRSWSRESSRLPPPKPSGSEKSFFAAADGERASGMLLLSLDGIIEDTAFTNDVTVSTAVGSGSTTTIRLTSSCTGVSSRGFSSRTGAGSGFGASSTAATSSSSTSTTCTFFFRLRFRFGAPSSPVVANIVVRDGCDGTNRSRFDDNDDNGETVLTPEIAFDVCFVVVQAPLVWHIARSSNAVAFDIRIICTAVFDIAVTVS